MSVKTVQIGDLAEDFTLPDINLERWRLSDHRGRVVALLFYPGDETLVCTRQLCAVRDNWAKYLETGAEVVGISPGGSEEHRKFAGHHDLPLTLLNDDNREITNRFVKHSWMPIWMTRGVVVIDAKGSVRYRNIMIRALRPTDYEILTAIHQAQYENLTERAKKLWVKR